MEKVRFIRQGAAILFCGALLLNSSTGARCTELQCYEQYVGGLALTPQDAVDACYSWDCADVCEDPVYCPDWWGEGPPSYCEPAQEADPPGSGFYYSIGYCDCHDIPLAPLAR